MNALHDQWKAEQAEQAEAVRYRRQMAELDAYANPSRESAQAAARLRQTLRARRLVRDLDGLGQDLGREDGR